MNNQSLQLRRLVLAAMFAAIATLLGPLSVPIGPTRVAPLQHTVNVVAAVMLGPWYAAGAALVTAVLRYNLHMGSIFAFPGSPFGALVVGYAYRWWRSDLAALTEPLGTGPIGATLAAAAFQPLVGSHHTIWWFQVAFLSSSIPGAVLGYVVLRLLRPALGMAHVDARV
ncbi:MAG TPA: energy coupling factor transporter S component ThiW [bacterium]|nr:energy coupling factor transporter S component ThiW [bacterium]